MCITTVLVLSQIGNTKIDIIIHILTMIIYPIGLCSVSFYLQSLKIDNDLKKEIKIPTVYTYI